MYLINDGLSRRQLKGGKAKKVYDGLKIEA